MFLTMKRSSFIQTFLFLFHFILFIYLFLIYTLKEYWAIPFFIHSGVWTTKFWKTSTPWKEWLFDSSGILWNFNLRQFDRSEKFFESATLKKVNIPNLPPGKIYLEIETPGKITIRGPPGFLHPYPCMDKME